MGTADIAIIGAVPSKGTIEITQYIDLTITDPKFFERSYARWSRKRWPVKPFYLLKEFWASST